ncbi:MAG TPA: DUF4105 domain-containing protein [Cyclobacteriaceae bacterium]|jgi:hypothetical protein|nr:DUF4105 domain-containing protein [Cyclobacteriaceae bacterium]
MRKLAIFLALIYSATAYSQTIQLSDQTEVSVLTCGPTQEELYSAFGHSAFHISDPNTGIDEVYNYGVFDFNQPNFYLNFTRGHLNYQLGVHDFQLFRDHYIAHNRYIHEQVLNLTQEQKQKVYDFLQWNAKPENEHYFYDYFYDNCATKMRDVILKVFGNDVTFDGSYIKTDYTIRQLTDIYLKQQPWGDLGIDICLGLPMDKKASPLEYMFLPDYVESGFNHATIKKGDTTVPLVKETISVYESREIEPDPSLPNPVYFFSALAVMAIILAIYDFKRKKISTWFDAILFTVVGLIGTLLLFLWVATDHKAAADNLNILWALPTHLIAAIAFIKQPAWLKKYFLTSTAITVFVLVMWPILPQLLHYALIPVVIALAIRSFVQYRLR